MRSLEAYRNTHSFEYSHFRLIPDRADIGEGEGGS